jgi:hypothetical protein
LTIGRSVQFLPKPRVFVKDVCAECAVDVFVK